MKIKAYVVATGGFLILLYVVNLIYHALTACNRVVYGVIPPDKNGYSPAPYHPPWCLQGLDFAQIAILGGTVVILICLCMTCYFMKQGK